MTMMIKSAANYCCEEDQNSYNCGITAVLSKSKRSRFVARTIHKLKKILKLRSAPKPSSIDKLSLEERQNAENERLNQECWRTLDRSYYHDDAYSEENSINEYWENWDACQLCAGSKTTSDVQYSFDHHQPADQTHSICYVFMPDQYEPVAVKLRSARIPGGILCVSYRPDVDIRNNGYVYSYTSYQQPQAQQALRPIMV